MLYFCTISWNHYRLLIVLNRNFCFRLSNCFQFFYFFIFVESIPMIFPGSLRMENSIWGYFGEFHHFCLSDENLQWWVYVLLCLVYLYSIITCSWLFHFNCSYYRGIRVHCTLWDDFALKMQQFLDTRDPSLPVVIIIQLCKLKKYLGKKKQCPFNLLFEF
jgi:hypothetical protein